MAARTGQALFCHFPATGRSIGGPKRPLSVRVELRHLDNLQKLVERNDGTDALSAVVRAAWALSLRVYTGLNEVCFGFEQVGGPSRAGDEKHGTCTVARFDENTTLEELARQAQDAEGAFGESSDSDVAFNTSVMVRFGAAASSKHQLPSKTTNMSDKVYPRKFFENSAFAYFNDPQCQIRLLVKVLKSGVSAFLEYRNSFIPTEQAKNIASTVDKALSNLLVSPGISIGEASFLSHRNKSQIEKWNSKPLENVQKTIHEIIREIVQKVPDQEAVCAWDGSFSYRELDRCANRLASHLVDLGVGPEIIVPLCFDKSKWNIVAILGTLYAGGACKLIPIWVCSSWLPHST